MTNEINKPIVRQYHENEWEFVYPDSIDNEKVYEQYCRGIDFLDYDDKEAEKIFKALIAKYPFYIDAYNHLSLAFRNQKKVFESLLTAEKAYRLGKECFPTKFNFKKEKLIWSNLDNRPFLRACQIYGLECQYHKDYAKAIEVYNENLSLNENDNQGIRYLLLESLFASKDYKQVKQLLDKHSDDYSIEFKFGSIALDILENNVAQADSKLEDAKNVNKFFMDEVVKSKHVKPAPFRLPGEPNFDAGITLGSIQLAFDYWERNKDLYKTKKIVDYFKERSNSTTNI